MPLVTGNFSDVAERVSKQYWYDHTQSSLKVTNTGLFPIIVEVSDEVKVINAGANYTFIEEFKSFFVRCKTKKGNESAAFSIETDSYRAAIENFEGGGGADLTEVNTRLSALENPLTINSFTITNPTTAREVGATLSSVTFSWDIENYSGTGAKLQDITSNTKLVDITSATKTHTQPVDVTKNTPGTQSYQLQITVGTKTITSTTRTINWYYPMFYGSSTKASELTETEVEDFTKSLKANASGSYSFGAVANSYKWIFVHESFNPTSFKSGGFDMPMQSPITLTITNEFGVRINLKGYRTTNQTSGALTIVVA